MADQPNKDTQLLQEYLEVIASYTKEFKPWENRVSKIQKRYRDDGRTRTETDARFNILWANVQTLVPATFSRLPQPDVSRRFRDNDPVGRVASLILERDLDYEVQHYPDYRTSLKQCVLDRFLGGRGTIWARYEPHFKAMGLESNDPDDGVQITEDTDEPPDYPEQLDYECAPIDYVHWKDFGHNVSRTWEEVTKVWRVVYMSEEAVRDRFGEKIASKLSYDASPEDLNRYKANNSKKQASVTELWDKTTGEAVWIGKGVTDFLDRRKDPLQLLEFFPCPKPLYSTLTNSSLIPVPDFILYQDQARELDILADRIKGLAYMLQVKGVYDGSADSAIGRLFTEGNNGKLLPVKNWAAFAEKNGLAGQIDILDLQMVGNALIMAYQAMDQAKQQVYEITGIADIIRGQGEANETAAAQRLKGQYASLRLKSLQDEVAQFATDALRLKAQIMCGKFQPQTLLQMAAVDQLSPFDQGIVMPFEEPPEQPEQPVQPGQPEQPGQLGPPGQEGMPPAPPVINPGALALLIGQERLQDPEADSPNPLRSFRIEIAADALVQIDEQQEKQDRMEMLVTFGTYIEKVAMLGAQAPESLPLLIEVGKFGLSAFKVGKNIEGTFDEMLDRIKEQSMMPPPEPPPDPEMIKIQGEMQLAEQKFQLESNKQQAETQGDMEIKQQEVLMENERMKRDDEREAQKMQMEFSMEQQRLNGDEEREKRKADYELMVAQRMAEIEEKKALVILAAEKEKSRSE